jgi:hypothetical protein
MTFCLFPKIGSDGGYSDLLVDILTDQELLLMVSGK